MDLRIHDKPVGTFRAVATVAPCEGDKTVPGKVGLFLDWIDEATDRCVLAGTLRLSAVEARELAARLMHSANEADAFDSVWRSSVG